MSSPGRTSASLTVLLAVLAVACGNGENTRRPAEALFFVRGASGTPFEVAALQASNAVHVDVMAGQEPLQAPYTFVMLNADPVVSGAFRNLAPLDSGLPITVTLVLGLDIANVQEIPPGRCCVVTPGATCLSDSPVCDHPPAPLGREVQFNVTSLVVPPDNIPFTASIGDLVNGTDATSCAFSGSTLACQTPVTFFLEGAEDMASGVFNKADSSQLNIQAELLVDGQQKAIESGRTNVIVSANL